MTNFNSNTNRDYYFQSISKNYQNVRFIFIYLHLVLQIESSIKSDYTKFLCFIRQFKKNCSNNYMIERFSWIDLPGACHVQEYLRLNYIKNWKPSTLRNISTNLEGFLVYYKGIGKHYLDEITRGDIEAYVEKEQDRGLKISTVRDRLISIYTFMRFLVEKQIVHPDILKRKLRLKLPMCLPRHIIEEDIKRLRGVIDRIRDKAMILLLLRTGMRIGELLNTKVCDIDIKQQKILIYEGEKNGQGRVVHFSDDACEAVKAWLKERDERKEYLIYGPGMREQLSYSGAKKVFTRYIEKAGLSGMGYTLHCLRHTCATDLLNAGMRLECLQQLLGHSSIEVTRRYARLSDTTRENEYFKAMSVIEGRKSNVNHRFHSELQEVLKEEKSLTKYSKELYQPA